MKRFAPVLVSLLALGALQPAASADTGAALKSNGHLTAWEECYGQGAGCIWYFTLTGSLHIGNRVWHGEAHARNPSDNATEMGMWGTSPDGELSTKKCVDGIPKDLRQPGVIVCTASIDGSSPKPLVLHVTEPEPYVYGGYYEASFDGP